MTNTDGQSGIKTGSFTVNAAPTVTSTREGTVQITANLTAAAAVAVRITNMAGYEIAALAPQALGPGISTLHWNGRSSKGTLVPRGRYMAQLQACSPEGAQTQCSVPIIW